jgi:myo-inositol-1(or 4)-monophosphatase
MADELAVRFDLACAIAREAGALAAKSFRAGGGPHSFKGRHDYLTETDTAVEQFIRARITAAFAADDFLGEETAGDFTASSPDVWVVDPIDGTANFARGIQHFCTSIAFVRGRSIELGVIYQPMLDELYAARRGAGATCNGRTMSVSGKSSIDEAVVEAGWSTRVPNKAYVALVERLYQAGAEVRRAGSGSLGLAHVADGRIDAYGELHMNSWDALAGLLLIREAGGWVNDFLSNQGLQQGAPVLGCTRDLAGPLRDIFGLSLSDATS